MLRFYETLHFSQWAFLRAWPCLSRIMRTNVCSFWSSCNQVTFAPHVATKPISILNNPKVDFMQTSDQVLARLQVPSQWSSSGYATQKPYVTQTYMLASNQNSGSAFCRGQDVSKLALATGSSSAPAQLSSPNWVVRVSPN